MNLDEWMKVWKSQDAAPVHGVKESLLQLALRQEEAQVQKRRRQHRLIRYASSAFVIGLLALLLTLMFQIRGRSVMTGWDYAMGIGGVAAGLFAGAATYRRHCAQVRREEGFGESLRDQINRRIAQLDELAVNARLRSLSFVMMGAICPLAILHLGLRVNDKTLGDAKTVPVVLLVCCFFLGLKSLRVALQHATARKRDLETLRAELDGR